MDTRDGQIKEIFNKMRGLYKVHIDCGRMGRLYGVIIADTEAVNELIESKRQIHFGEVLGKHSSIAGSIEPTDVTLLTTDAAFIEQAEQLGICVGINPFDYIEGDE